MGLSVSWLFCLLWPCLLIAPIITTTLDLKSDFGKMTPSLIPIVKVGGNLQINCTVNPMTISMLTWAFDTSPFSAAMFWQKNAFHLHPENDPRISVKMVDQWTIGLWLVNATVEDSGSYKCVIRNGTNDGMGLLVDTSTVVVAGGPVKYTDFRCESENFKNLVCKWKRGDRYSKEGAPRDARTKYTLHFRLIHEAEHVSRAVNVDVKGDYYRAELNSSTVKPFMLEYKHVMTITGTNLFGTETWTEEVQPNLQIRPNPPLNLNATLRDSTTCGLTWKVSYNLEGSVLRDYGLDFEIGVQMDGYQDWTVVRERDFSHDLKDLYANTLYHIRIRSVVPASGFWSDYSNVTCKTDPIAPRENPKPVPGAYEELGTNGVDRKVLLYWQGIPYLLRNAPDFHYKVYVSNNNFQSDVRYVGRTEFANIELSIPVNQSVTVKIEPGNQEGSGDKSGITLIPPIHDRSVIVNSTNVVRFFNTSYEVSWDTSQPVEVVDIFWCQTSLLPHLAKCTDVMGYRAVFTDTYEGRNKAVNITNLDPKHYYRFAVAARLGDNYSGMNWVPRICNVEDKQPRLGGLLVTPLLNASMEIAWYTPCQARFMPITGYHVFYYICPLDSHNQCQKERLSAEKDLIQNIQRGTSKLIVDLEPETRYCFVVRVHVEAENYNIDDPISDSEQCAVTLPLIPVPPVGSIVGGAISGAALLVVVAILVWTGVRRLRKDLTQIQKESCKIIIPPIHSDKFNDEADLGYSKINCEEKPPGYFRQMSENSGSSGLGSSTSSQYDGRTGTLNIDTHKQKLDVIFAKKHSAGSRPSQCSMVDLSNVRSQLEAIKDSTETVSLASNDNDGLLYRKTWKITRLGSLETKANTVPSRQISGDFSGSISGTDSLTDGPDDTTATSGYVAASNFEPSSGNQSGANTGDMGYVSHPSESSENQDLSGFSRRSGSSGFSETNSPAYYKKDAGYTKSLLNSKSSYGSDVDSVELRPLRRNSEEGFLSSESSGQSSPFSSHNLIKLAKCQQNETTGYVSWPVNGGV